MSEDEGVLTNQVRAQELRIQVIEEQVREVLDTITLQQATIQGLQDEPLLIEQLEHDVAAKVLGWALADVCIMLDQGRDPRREDITHILPRCFKDLGITML